MKNLLKFYKIPLLVSITLSVVIIATTTQRIPLNIFLIFLVSFISILVVDLDYFIHSYFFDPELEFSKNFKAYIKDKDYAGAFVYANVNEDKLSEKTIHSALFQALFALFTIFVAFSDSYIVFKSFVIAILANSIYKYIEYYYTKDIKNWFWAFKIGSIKEVSAGFLIGLVAVLIVSLLVI